MPGRSVTWTLMQVSEVVVVMVVMTQTVIDMLWCLQAASACLSLVLSYMILGFPYMMCFIELWIFNITQVTWCFALMARS